MGGLRERRAVKLRARWSRAHPGSMRPRWKSIRCGIGRLPRVAKRRIPYSGPGKWLSGYDLDKLCVGASASFAQIGSDTIQRVNAECAKRRTQFHKAKLRWRVSHGSSVRSDGFPSKRGNSSVRQNPCACGQAFRVFERELLEEVSGTPAALPKMRLGIGGWCLPGFHRRAGRSVRSRSLSDWIWVSAQCCGDQRR